MVRGTSTNVPASRLVAHSDGSAVVYGPGWTCRWHTAVSSPGEYIAIQNDGNVIVYATSGTPLRQALGFTGHWAVLLL